MNSIAVAAQRLTRLVCLAASRTLVALLVWGVGASLVQAQIATWDCPDEQRMEKTPAPCSMLDFKLYRGYLIVVPGAVGGLKDLHFLLDTGASGSIADRRLVEKLRAQHGSGNLYLPGEVVSAGHAVLTDVQVGPLLAKSLPVFALDLSSLERELGTRIDMLVGLDVFRQSFTIDYEAKRIVFGQPLALPITVPMQSSPPSVSVTVWLDGQAMRMLVNSASPDLMLTGPGGKAALQKVKVDQAKMVINAAGGELAFKQAVAQSVRLGEAELGRQAAFFVNRQKDPFDGSFPIPGRFKQVAFDFEHHMMGFRR